MESNIDVVIRDIDNAIAARTRRYQILYSEILDIVNSEMRPSEAFSESVGFSRPLAVNPVEIGKLRHIQMHLRNVQRFLRKGSLESPLNIWINAQAQGVVSLPIKVPRMI